MKLLISSHVLMNRYFCSPKHTRHTSISDTTSITTEIPFATCCPHPHAQHYHHHHSFKTNRTAMASSERGSSSIIRCGCGKQFVSIAEIIRHQRNLVELGESLNQCRRGKVTKDGKPFELTCLLPSHAQSWSVEWVPETLQSEPRGSAPPAPSPRTNMVRF